MLNMNSPTVQAMLNNTPQGFGNMPVYYGSAPVVTESVEPVQSQQRANIQQPFPSPKEMISQGGQNMIYAPTSFQPRNIVGGYNPGFQAAFAGYSNPFMGYGYSGYGNTMYPNNYGYMMNMGFVSPPDEDSRQRLEAAYMNGYVDMCEGDLVKAYDMQLVTESELYKKISRTVSKNLGRSEEEAKQCEEAFSIYNKYKRPEEETKKKPTVIHIKLKIGDEVVADCNPAATEVKDQAVAQRPKQNYAANVQYIDYFRMQNAIREANNISKCNMLYNNAPERQFDTTDLYDFFNYGAGVIMADSLNRELNDQRMRNVGKAYNNEAFHKLLVNNGLRTKNQVKAVDRFCGRYGIMPDGRPVSPGHDPAVATSFSYDPKTGQYNVTAPNFIRDRLEHAREVFIKSID